MAIESALREPDDTLFATRFADQMDAESWKAIADVLGRQKITDSETRVFVEMLDEVSVHRMKIPSDDKVAQMLLARVRQVAGRRREELLNRLELAPIPWTPGLRRQGLAAPVCFGLVGASVVV